MRRISGKRTLALFLVSLSAALCLQAPTASASKANLGTITGAVLDNKGNPVSGALISLLRDGASKVVKQTRSDASGRFSTRISPGRKAKFLIKRDLALRLRVYAPTPARTAAATDSRSASVSSGKTGRDTTSREACSTTGKAPSL